MSAEGEAAKEEQLADLKRVEEEAEAAAEEAARIGGKAPVESDDPSQQPLIEAGQGESEGFELAEARLRDIASHGDEHRFPDRDVRPAEDREDVERGEADQTIPADG
ncbi:MAG TPA: hypothetical protein VGO36_01865 [Solirubrobacterales bacterium]|jgi:hypothetical protein|nr:hypothetical protein [Solirubrobacterales bacterium]